MQYDKVFFQKEADDAAVIETVAAFDIYCAEFPFSIAGKAKDITTRDWHDEDGLDAYVPKELKLADYEIEAKFCCKGDKFSSNDKLRSFIDYLTGSGGTGAYLKVYCTLTKIGRQHVRFLEIDDDATLVRDGDGDILVFKVKFSVDDPVTDITPKTDSKGNVTNLV